MDSLTKSDIINNCIKDLLITNNQLPIMIGDSAGDAIGAEKCGIDFMAVTYGFGFKHLSELGQIKKRYTVENPNGIIDILR